jgi:hypothetical protein
MRRSSEEIARILAQCRKALEAEFTMRRPHSFPRLLRIPAERRAILDAIGNTLLGASLVLGVGGTAWTAWQRSFATHEKQGLSSQNPPAKMDPNGSIPTIERPLGRLSRPFSNWRNRYFVSGLIGATPMMATQPELSYKGYHQVRNWLSGIGRTELEESVTLTLKEVYQGDLLALPIRGRVDDPMAILWTSDRLTLISRDARDVPITLLVPPEKLVDREITAEVLRETLGSLHWPLWKPRLPFSTIREVSPELADAIEAARAMPAVGAVEHLKEVVSRLLKYENTPAYDGFGGDFESYFREILHKGQGICGQFAIIYDEALKQAGIPSCIAMVYIPSEDGVTYTTRGAHATNLVILVTPDKEPTPRIFDATGIGAVPPASREWDPPVFQDLVLPASVLGGGAGLALLLMVRRNQRLREELENEALRSAREKPEEEPQQSAAGDNGLVGGSAGEDGKRSSAIRPELVLSRWILHHLQSTDSQDAQIDASKGFFELAEFDIEPALEAANEMKESLLLVEPMTNLLLEKTGLPQQDEVVGILNGWYRGMQDLGYRREWIGYLKRRDIFSSGEASALVELAREVVPAIKSDREARALVSRWNPFYRRTPLDVECLLRAFAPLPKES